MIDDWTFIILGASIVLPILGLTAALAAELIMDIREERRSDDRES